MATSKHFISGSFGQLVIEMEPLRAIVILLGLLVLIALGQTPTAILCGFVLAIVCAVLVHRSS